MKKCLSLFAIVLVALLAAGADEADEKKTWITEDGHAMAIHAGHRAMFLSDDEGETFDLSDLNDGETRLFGEGNKHISVIRLGDIVTINREARGNEKALEIKCTVDRDTCQVITFQDEPEKVMIVVKKTRECVNDVGDCGATVDVTLDHLSGIEGGKVHTVVRKVECDDQGNCKEFEDIHSHGGPGMVEVIADFDSLDHGGGNVMIVADDAALGKATLRCPEGDSTIHVEQEEAEDIFLCPKHNVPMEKVAMPHFIRKIRLEGDE